jgi:hypothetical protein
VAQSNSEFIGHLLNGKSKDLKLSLWLYTEMYRLHISRAPPSHQHANQPYSLPPEINPDQVWPRSFHYPTRRRD